MVRVGAAGALSLLLGLATTVGVAKWGEGVTATSWTAEMQFAGYRGEQDGYAVLTQYRLTAVSDISRVRMDGAIAVRHSSLSAARWRELIDLTLAEDTPVPNEVSYLGHMRESIHVYMQQYGWPLRSFFTVGVHEAMTNSVSPHATIATSLPYAPGQVIWWPLLANTAFFAALWGLLMGAIPLAAAARRGLRRRRGHCPACNYNRDGLTADAICPECGKPP